ncbi:MAG: type II secretion system protein [Candidatus Levybacteria bacterium]|nr:type II secretion system protein [Candidatus Levybacteria bacterium]
MNKIIKYLSTLISQFSSQKGFTLVEMLIVIGLVGVVAATLLVGINPIDQIRKSSDAERKSDLAQLQRALELYYQDNGKYPPSSADFKLYINNMTLAWGSPWKPYINSLPKDSSPTLSYQYYSPLTASGQTYYIYASLERGAKDPQVCNQGNACVSLTTGGGFPPATACGSTCNYAVSSPNVAP